MGLASRGRLVIPLIFAAMILATPLNGIYAVIPPCLYPTAWFASEILLNKPGVEYDLSKLTETGNVTTRGLSVVYRSHYNESVAVILTPMEILKEKGLDVRMQIPTRKVYRENQYLEFRYLDETSRVGDLQLMGGRDLDWTLEQSFSSRVFGGPPIQISNLTKGKFTVSLIPVVNETTPGIEIIIEAKEMPALTREDRAELSKIMEAVEYPLSFEALLSRSEFKNLTRTAQDLESAIGLNPENFKWSEAMKTELKWLVRNRVVRGLSDEDVDTLSNVAPQSWGDYNLKTRYFNGKWTLGVTDEMVEGGYALPNQGEPNCEGFPLTAAPAGTISDFNVAYQPLEVLFEQSYEGFAVRVGILVAVVGIVTLQVRRYRRGGHKRKLKRRL